METSRNELEEGLRLSKYLIVVHVVDYDQPAPRMLMAKPDFNIFKGGLCARRNPSFIFGQLYGAVYPQKIPLEI
jgi:hypothetical protein